VAFPVYTTILGHLQVMSILKTQEAGIYDAAFCVL